MLTLPSSSPRRLLSCRLLPPVKRHRHRPLSPSHQFGRGLIQTVAALDEWTVGEARFELIEYANPDTHRFELRCYREDVLVRTLEHDSKRTAELYAETFAEVVAQDVEAERAAEHIEACRAFEVWMASEGRLPELAPICGGAPERPEATEADRRWWAANCPSERPRRGGYACPVTDEDVMIATGCCG